MTATAAVSVWDQMPSDMLGVILDEADLAERIAPTLRMASDLVPPPALVGLAMGLHGLGSVVEGRIGDLGRRNSASMPGFGQNTDALVEPRDAVPPGSLGPAANEIGRELATRLILAFRDATRY